MTLEYSSSFSHLSTLAWQIRLHVWLQYEFYIKIMELCCMVQSPDYFICTTRESLIYFNFIEWDCNFSKNSHTIIFLLDLVPITWFYKIQLISPSLQNFGFCFPVWDGWGTLKSWSLQFIWTYLLNLFCPARRMLWIRISVLADIGFITDRFFLLVFSPVFACSSSWPAGDVSLHMCL